MRGPVGDGVGQEAGHPGVAGEVRASSAARGSPEMLFSLHYAKLVTALAAVNGDREGAADAVQEAFVELWRRWDKLSGYEDPVGWVRRVAVHRLCDQRRALARRTALLLRMRRPAELTSPADPHDSAMVSMFQGLPSRQRLALALHYLADLSLPEVAQAMGISEGAVKQHLHRGREAMRRSMEVGNER